MIPLFPSFKKVDITDKSEIELHTHAHLPYSDFNFTSLWAWDTNNERMVSLLNNNLVVLFTDYKTYKPSLSFIGKSKIEETIKTLLDFSNAIGIEPALSYISQEIKDEISNDKFQIKEDIDNFDYVISVTDMIELQGSKFKSMRHEAHKFESEFPSAVFVAEEITSSKVQEDIIALIRRWEQNKIAKNKEYEIEHEEIAIKRILAEADMQHILLSCVYINDILIGFSFDEVLPMQYGISHFFKTDNSYSGVSSFLNQKVAERLKSNSCMYWNFEQDLGIENLRKSKMGCNPVSFLKKYKVTSNKQLK